MICSENYYRLKFSPAVATDVKEASRNPETGTEGSAKTGTEYRDSTKSQQALKLQQEQLKTERKTVSREKREVEKQRQFELKQQKRKEKHRVGNACPAFVKYTLLLFSEFRIFILQKLSIVKVILVMI
mgnify:CR=1 FL=1